MSILFFEIFKKNFSDRLLYYYMQKKKSTAAEEQHGEELRSDGGRDRSRRGATGGRDQRRGAGRDPES